MLCLLTLSRHPIGHSVEEFPVPLEQSSQIKSVDNVLSVHDADSLHVNVEGGFCTIGNMISNSYIVLILSFLRE